MHAYGWYLNWSINTMRFARHTSIRHSVVLRSASIFIMFTVGVGLPFLVSYFWPGEYGGFSAGWSVAVVLWAAAVLAATWGAGLRRKAKRS